MKITRRQLRKLIAEVTNSDEISRALEELIMYKDAVWLPKPDNTLLKLLKELSGAKRGFKDSRGILPILEDLELELKNNEYDEADPGDVNYLLGLVDMAKLGY
jgi:hypothetical protein